MKLEKYLSGKISSGPYIGDRRGGGVATRIAEQDGIWRPTLSNIKTVPTHGKIETISEKLAHRKFIKDSEFETREVFERENIETRIFGEY